MKNENKGRITVQYLEKKKSVYIHMDMEACSYLLGELKEILTDREDCFLDYDSATGYDCGVLAKNSLGIALEVVK